MDKVCYFVLFLLSVILAYWSATRKTKKEPKIEAVVEPVNLESFSEILLVEPLAPKPPFEESVVATASVCYTTDLAQKMSKVMTDSYNEHIIPFLDNGFSTSRKPDYFVYLYNVSALSFDVSRSPIIDRLKIRGKSVGKKYNYVGKFPQPLLMPIYGLDSEILKVEPSDARRFAMDICNPDNIGLDQDGDARWYANDGSNDLGKRGLFWSLNNPPKLEEVRAAYARMEKHYTKLLEQATVVELSDPKQLDSIITPEHHAAANHFKIQTVWHSTPYQTRKIKVL